MCTSAPAETRQSIRAAVQHCHRTTCPELTYSAARLHRFQDRLSRIFRPSNSTLGCVDSVAILRTSPTGNPGFQVTSTPVAGRNQRGNPLKADCGRCARPPPPCCNARTLRTKFSPPMAPIAQNPRSRGVVKHSPNAIERVPNCPVAIVCGRPRLAARLTMRSGQRCRTKSPAVELPSVGEGITTSPANRITPRVNANRNGSILGIWPTANKTNNRNRRLLFGIG